MREFKVLPTDSRFTSLTDLQIEFILYNMIQDNKEQELLAKGKKADAYFADGDSSWLDASEEDFEVVPETMDLEDITKQIESRLSEDENRRRKESFESDDPDERDRTDLIQEMIDRKIEELDEDLGITNEEPVEYSKDTISKALEDIEDDGWI